MPTRWATRRTSPSVRITSSWNSASPGNATDHRSLVPVVEAVEQRCAERPQKLNADAVVDGAQDDPDDAALRSPFAG